MNEFTLNHDLLDRVLADIQSVFECSIEGVTKNWEDKPIAQLEIEIDKMNENQRIKAHFEANKLKATDIHIEYFEMTNSPDFSIFTFDDFVVILDCNAKAGNQKMNVVFPVKYTSWVNHLTQYKKAMVKYNGCVPGQTSWYN